jgi:glycerol-3-phosphate O-acyltransferase
MCADLLCAAHPEDFNLGSAHNLDIKQASQRAADRLGINVQQVHSYMNALSGSLNRSSLGLMAIGLKKFLASCYSGIEVHGDLQGGKFNGPVVLLPTHRSHMDYLIISYACYVLGLEMPMIAAGENLRMPIVGNFLANCGAFFIKRSFKEDLVYKAVFKEWMVEIMKNHQTMEFFPEGGRSRTGRTCPLKLGILKLYCEGVVDGVIEDVTFVPIDITYELISESEMSAFINQRLGKPKEKESIIGLLQSLFKGENGFTKKKAHISFGTPFSYQSLVEKTRNSSLNSCLSEISRNISMQFKNLFRICTPQVLYSSVLFEQYDAFHHYSTGNNYYASVFSQVVQFLCHDKSNYRDQCSIDASQIAEYPYIDPCCSGIQLAGLEIHKELSLSYYRNQLGAILCFEAISCTVINSRAQIKGKGQILNEMIFLFDLFKNEFPGSISRSSESVIQSLTDCELLDGNLNITNPTLGRFLAFLVKPLIETYATVASFLINNDYSKREIFGESAYIDYAKDLLKESFAYSGEILCIQTASNAFRSLREYSVTNSETLELIHERLCSYLEAQDPILNIAE